MVTSYSWCQCCDVVTKERIQTRDMVENTLVRGSPQYITLVMTLVETLMLKLECVLKSSQWENLSIPERSFLSLSPS